MVSLSHSTRATLEKTQTKVTEYSRKDSAELSSYCESVLIQLCDVPDPKVGPYPGHGRGLEASVVHRFLPQNPRNRRKLLVKANRMWGLVRQDLRFRHGRRQFTMWVCLLLLFFRNEIYVVKGHKRDMNSYLLMYES